MAMNGHSAALNGHAATAIRPTTTAATADGARNGPRGAPVDAADKGRRAGPPKEAPAMRNRTLVALLAGVALGTYWLTESVYREQIDAWVFVSRTGWHHPWVPTVAVVLYLAMVYLLPRFMANRAPVELKYTMFVHNFILSAGSLVMTIAVGREAFEILMQPNGLEEAVCDPSALHPQRRIYFWYYVFYISKMYEFIDTLILCLRKKSLIFLHVYHHIITLWLVWVCLDDRLSIQWLDTIANTIVHVFMYYFYACQTVGINVWWKKYLTSLQIFQFIADETGNVFWSYYAAYLGRTCSGSWFGFWFGMLVIASFLGLFIQFYQSSYSKPKGGSAKASKDD